MPGADLRFLAFEAWPGGLNNVRMNLETVLLLAVLTGRVLVLPATWRRIGIAGHRDDGPPHPADFMTLGRAAAVHPVVTAAGFARWRAAHRGVAPVPLEFSPERHVYCPGGIPSLGSSSARGLAAFACGREPVALTSAQRRAPWLQLGPVLETACTFFFAEAQRRRDWARWLRDRLGLRPEIIATALHLTRQLGPFDAVHFRSTDFAHFVPDRRHVDLAGLADTLRRQLPGDCPVYVASDEPDRARLHGLRARFDARFLEDLVPDLGLPMELAACVEQVICAQARTFVGTRLSTFSAYVQRLRGHRGAADQRLRFTDGSWTDRHDRAGSPPHDWCNWMRAGQPLWGREFRESWQC